MHDLEKGDIDESSKSKAVLNVLPALSTTDITRAALLHRHLLRSHDSTAPDIDADDLYDISKPSNRYITFLQFFCVGTSIAAVLYFVIALRYYNVATQYMQITFITSLIISLDSKTICQQVIWLVVAASMATLWIGIWMYSTFYIHNAPCYLTMAAASGLFYFGGILFMTVKACGAPPEVKFVELDLLLYLLSLNAICFFNSNEFNNNLHMILDIRVIMLLFNCLYQPKQKMELLRIPTFVSVIVLVLVAFILYSSRDESGTELGNGVYVAIGIILIRESIYAKPIQYITKESLYKLNISLSQQNEEVLKNL
jgi:hypothetical protein